MASTAPDLTLSTTAAATGAPPSTLVALTAWATWLCSVDVIVRVTLPVVVRLVSRSPSVLAGRVWDSR